MARPNTGGLKKTPMGWQARTTVNRDPIRRIRHVFAEKEVAEAWLSEVAIALEANLPTPDPDLFEALRAERKGGQEVGHAFAEVAWSAWAEEYRDDPRTGAEMAMKAEQLIRQWINPYFVAVSGTVEEVTRDHVKSFVRTMSGRSDFVTDTSVAGRPQVDPTAILTVTQVAQVLGQSRSSVLRYVNDGRFPNHYRVRAGEEKGQIRIPGSDLLAAKFKSRPVAIPEKGRITSGIGSGGASVATQRDILHVLRRILAWARGKKLITGDPTQDESPMKPLASKAITKANKENPRPFSLTECVGVAAHLHIHHQMVFWMQRIMGLRVSEVYGVSIDDIYDVDTRGAIKFDTQGGKKFWVRDENDQIIRVDEKKGMKSQSSERLIVVPEQLMSMIRLYIRAFHMDPETSEVNPEARFIVGLRKPEFAGSSSYRSSLAKAFEAESLSFNDVGFRASTHHLRRSMTTDADTFTNISQWLLSAMLGHAPKGHEGGADMTRAVYILKAHKVMEPMIHAAQEIEALIVAEGCQMVVASAKKPQYGHGHYLREERWADHVAQVLAEGGLAATETAMLTIIEAALRLGVKRDTLSGWVRSGRMAAIEVDAPKSSEPRYLIDPLVVEEYLEAQRARITVPEAAEELGILVWPIYRAIDAGRLPVIREGRRVYIRRIDLEAARPELLGSAEMHARSMSSFEAARVLKVGLPTIKALRKTGTLETDPDSPPNSAYVTRASVAAELERTAPSKPSREFDETKMMTLAEAQDVTGLRHNDLMRLAHAGVMIRRRGLKVYVERESLEAWMNKHDA